MAKAKAVFVPGLLCTAELFAPQLGALGERLDITIADHARADTMAAIAAQILADAPDRFVLAGLSMGGYIAQEMVRQAGERVSALILLDTNGRADTPEQTARRTGLLDLCDEAGLEPVIERLLPLFIAEDRLADAALVATVRRMALDTGPEIFARQQRAIMTRPDMRPALGAIGCPARVIVGDKDVLTPPELSREIADMIPGAKLEIIPDCGHLSTLERPDVVNAAIISFLEGAGIE